MDYELGDSRPWPIPWAAVWVGALAALAVGLIIGLIGLASGAHEASRAFAWKHVRLTTLLFSVGGAFFAFVAGGWAAARIAGARRAETACLYGALAWLVTVPILLVLAALGVAGRFGGWYGGLAGAPAWTTAVPPVDPAMAESIRNNALASVLALLLGLVGGVIGGWMASGEPMTWTYYGRRQRTLRESSHQPRRVA
jgi:hypothetical protein